MSTYTPRMMDTWLQELMADVPGVLLVGPRATGKTTTALRHTSTTLRLDQLSVRQALEADPDALLRDATPPVLVDEWQLAPSAMSAAKRLIDETPSPGRFLFTGSAAAELSADGWPATGRFIRVPLWGLTEREWAGSARRGSFIDWVLDHDFDGRIELPDHRPDTADYLDCALRSGFPEARRRGSERTRAAWLNSYVDQIVGRDLAFVGESADPRRLRRYLRALAASTAGTPVAATLCQAADVSRETVSRYDALLERLFITEQVPAWSSNRLARVTSHAKRYVCDAAIAATLLGTDRQAILRDADLSGRIIDTFVTSQIRPELELGIRPATMYHLRTQGGRHEIDLIIERTDGAILAIEVKAAKSADLHDARHLTWLRANVDATAPFTGIVFTTGAHVVQLDERIWAVPICALWA